VVGSHPEDTTVKCNVQCRNIACPPISTLAESASQGSNPLLPHTTRTGRQHRCMKWTDEINIFIMQMYFRITKAETDFTAYGQNNE